MAKKKLNELIGEEAPKPEVKPGVEREMGRSISVGVGLKEGEVEELDELASAYGFSRNAIMAWFIRHGMKEVREGRLELPVETETVRKLGDV